MRKNDVRVTTPSDSRSLGLLPIQYRHCARGMTVAVARPAAIRLPRANLVETVAEFSGHIDLRVARGRQSGERSACRRVDTRDPCKICFLERRSVSLLEGTSMPAGAPRGSRRVLDWKQPT